jgi:hypothetical protein
MRTLLALALVLLLSACLNPTSLLGGGGGPTVNANTQVGKENNQSAIDQSRDIEAENVQVDESKGSFNLVGYTLAGPRVDATISHRDMERVP